MWRGLLAPRRALVLIGGLFEIPRSRYAALVRGDGSFGWTTEADILADIDDTLLAIVAGLGGRKFTQADLHWRPKPPEDERARPRTIAEFDVAWFMHQL